MEEAQQQDYYYKNLTCCSIELHWEDKNKDIDALNSYDYELLYKQVDSKYSLIYKGKNIFYEVNNLISNTKYKFKLIINKSGKFLEYKKIRITTKKSPIAILSNKSEDIANGTNINYTNELSEYHNKVIKNCNKLIFMENNNNFIEGNFEGIEIKIAHENETNIYYISFDIRVEYFEEFFNKYIDECSENLIIPCHFIIQKLPTLLIFNLLKKGPVILTGKRMGGVIASSLAFYLLYFGKLKNKSYGNIFLENRENKENSIGVVTFGSPCFLTNLTVGIKMKELTSYFYHIKDELDYIPKLVDLLNNKFKKYINPMSLVEKNIFSGNEVNDLKNILNKLSTNLENNKIPFGYYFKMNSNTSLISINESKFENFYYSNTNNNQLSNLEKYKDLSTNFEYGLNKKTLELLENNNNNNNNNELEFCKIIRRIIKDDNFKAIIKLQLKEFEENYITPDIIDNITLKINERVYKIENKNIYYDNNFDLTAYIDNINENINTLEITNFFGGQIKSKHILNIKGAGSTRKMIRNCIEKLFLIPFFKLFEIFYDSLLDEEKYKNLKEKVFGNNFEELNIINPFADQMKILNDLLFLSRPDIIGYYEEAFKDILKKEEKKDRFFYDKINELFTEYYNEAKEIQRNQKINCIESGKNSIAYKTGFPLKFKEKDTKTKKLFMLKREYFHNKNFLTQKFDNTHIIKFFIDKLIKQVLQNLEKEFRTNLMRDKENLTDLKYKEFLSSCIEIKYDEYIAPKVYFIYLLILSSIENGDEINFNHDYDWEKIPKLPIIWNFPLFFLLDKEEKAIYEKDFERIYRNWEIESINIENLFYKIKTKNIVKSNIVSNENKNVHIINPSYYLIKYFFPYLSNSLFNNHKRNNKIFNFSNISEKQEFGSKYYKFFLEIFNNYSNDFEEDIEISIYDNLKEENQNAEKNFLTIKQMMNHLINEEESKIGFLALLRQSYLLGKLRFNIVSIYIFLIFYSQENEFIIGVFGKKKSGKSTFIKEVFRDCQTNNSYANSTKGLNFYTINGVENFAVFDSPGDTENEKFFELLSNKGYIYSKILIYIIDERKNFDADYLRKNRNLKFLIKNHLKYKLPLLILLSHSDNYCEEVKKTEKQWETICKVELNKNKKSLIDLIKEQIIKENINNVQIQENDIMHICLVESVEINNQEIIDLFDDETREEYNNSDENKKKEIIKFFSRGRRATENKIKDFLQKEINVLRKKELINKIKEKIPSQYHNVLNEK